MSTNQNIILFDLANKDGTSWSLNPWKTRFLLNFKGLNYDTEWLEYPDIKSRLEPHIRAESYTSPTIRYTDGRYIMDSKAIVDLIEKDHPSPPLHLDSPYLEKLGQAMPQIMPALRGTYIPLVPKRILNEASQEYWYRTREEMVGMKLDVLEDTEGGEPGLAKAEPLLRQVTGWLRENDDGPFFMGNTVSYADFVWAGFLIFFRRLGTDKLDQILERTGDPSLHLALLAAVEPWSKRDDH